MVGCGKGELRLVVGEGRVLKWWDVVKRNCWWDVLTIFGVKMRLIKDG